MSPHFVVAYVTMLLQQHPRQTHCFGVALSSWIGIVVYSPNSLCKAAPPDHERIICKGWQHLHVNHSKGGYL